MEKTNVGIELNSKLYNELDEICEDLGMSVDDAFQIFARKMVNEQGIPFEVTEKEYPHDEKHQLIKVAKIAASAALIISLIWGIVHLVRDLKNRF